MLTVHALQELQGVVSMSLLACSPWRSANKQISLPPPESCASLQRAWGPRQCSISPQALQQVVVERAKMPRSDVDSAECTPTKRKKSATITSSLYEARAGTVQTTD